MPRYIWWGYAKAMIRQYPKLQAAGDAQQLPATQQKEYEAVKKALEITQKKSNGENRIAVIDYVLWQKKCCIDQAAALLYVSETTARRYHGEFVRLVGECYGLTE